MPARHADGADLLVHEARNVQFRRQLDGRLDGCGPLPSGRSRFGDESVHLDDLSRSG